MLEQKYIDVLPEHLPLELNMSDEALLAWTSCQKNKDGGSDAAIA